MNMLPWHERSTTVATALQPALIAKEDGKEQEQLQPLEVEKPGLSSINKDKTLVCIIKYLATLLGET